MQGFVKYACAKWFIISTPFLVDQIFGLDIVRKEPNYGLKQGDMCTVSYITMTMSQEEPATDYNWHDCVQEIQGG